MQVFLGPGVSRGEDWLPDQIAKAIVNEKGLRKGQTVSKDEILDFMAKNNLGPMMVTDVAMVLRDVFGITPTFNEGKTMSKNSLINELTAVLEDREIEPEVPAQVNAEPVVVRDPFEVAVEAAFFSADGELSESIVAGLAVAGPEAVFDIASLVSDLDEDALAEMDECYARGGAALLESWGKAVFRPHMIRFMESKTRESLSEALEAVGARTLAQLAEAPHELDLGGGGPDLDIARPKKKVKSVQKPSGHPDRPPMIKGKMDAPAGPPGISVGGFDKQATKAAAPAPAKEAPAPAKAEPPAPAAAKPEPPPEAAPTQVPAHTPPPASTHEPADDGNPGPPGIAVGGFEKRPGAAQRGLQAMGSLAGRMKAAMPSRAPADSSNDPHKPGLLSRIGHAAASIAKGAIALPFGAAGVGAGLAAGGVHQGLGAMGRGFKAAYGAGKSSGANSWLANKAREANPQMAQRMLGPATPDDSESGAGPAPGLKRKFPKKVQ